MSVKVTAVKCGIVDFRESANRFDRSERSTRKCKVIRFKMHKVTWRCLLSLPCNIYLFTLISVHASGEVTFVCYLQTKRTIRGSSITRKYALRCRMTYIRVFNIESFAREHATCQSSINESINESLCPMAILNSDLCIAGFFLQALI